MFICQVSWNYWLFKILGFDSDTFSEKLVHLKKISLLTGIKDQICSESKSLQAVIKEYIDTLQINELNWYIKIINIFIQPCDEFRVAWLAGACSRTVCTGAIAAANQEEKNGGKGIEEKNDFSV